MCRWLDWGAVIAQFSSIFINIACVTNAFSLTVVIKMNEGQMTFERDFLKKLFFMWHRGRVNEGRRPEYHREL